MLGGEILLYVLQDDLEIHLSCSRQNVLVEVDFK